MNDISHASILAHAIDLTKTVLLSAPDHVKANNPANSEGGDAIEGLLFRMTEAVKKAAVIAAEEVVVVKEPVREKMTPKQVRDTIKGDSIISLIDGKSYKMLKRHLSTYGLTPDAYREKYGLPSDYPMTAPDYSKRRSEIAKASELGTSNRKG